MDCVFLKIGFYGDHAYTFWGWEYSPENKKIIGRTKNPFMLVSGELKLGIA